MKQFLLILLCVSYINVNYGQTITEVKKEDDEGKIFNKVEVDASFPGGDSAWSHFLKFNLNPNVPANNGADKGTYTCIVKFIVSRDSSVSDITCEKDPGWDICHEAIRLIKQSGKWNPARQNGRIVNAYHRQSFTYQVE